ncbi:hypothetical protein Hanom_Chr09g00869641 [Helianthus anomalus]
MMMMRMIIEMGRYLTRKCCCWCITKSSMCDETIPPVHFQDL